MIIFINCRQSWTQCTSTSHASTLSKPPTSSDSPMLHSGDGNHFCQFHRVPSRVNSPKISPNGDLNVDVLQDLCFQRDRVHRCDGLPERKGSTFIQNHTDHHFTNQLTKSLDEIAPKKIKILPSPVYWELPPPGRASFNQKTEASFLVDFWLIGSLLLLRLPSDPMIGD